MDEDFQRLLLRELAAFVEPLAQLAADPPALFDFLYRIGWDVESILGSDAVRVADAVTTIANAADTLTELTEDPPRSLADFGRALDAARTVFALVDALPSAFGAAAPSNVDALPGDLVEALALSYLERRSVRLFRLLELLTVIRGPTPAQQATDRDVLRAVHQPRRLELGRLGLLLTRPGAAFAEEYWPDGVTDRARAAEVAGRLFPRIQQLLVPHGANEPGVARRLVSFHGRGGGPADFPPEDEQRLAAMMTLVWAYPADDSATFRDIGVSVGILPADEGGPGVFAIPFGAAEFQERTGDLLVLLAGTMDAGGFQITRRGFDAFAADGRTPEAELIFAPVRDGSPRLLIGSVTGTRLEIGDWYLTAGLHHAQDGAEVRLMVSIVDAALVVAPDGADSFLGTFLPPDGARVTFELTAGWSNHSGFHVEGSGALESRIPAHVEIGPVVVTGVTLRVTADSGGIGASAGADLSVRLGPLTATVQDLGLRLDAGFRPSGGNAGPLDLAPGLKPPTGAGLAVDAGVVTGGGFLRFDPDRGEYAGMLALEFADFLALTGIGLITTRMPDGSAGFSVLIVLTSEFAEPGLQLGYGFRLLAVGGLLGLNRTVKMPALIEGVRTGAIESVMFPRDVIANAPRILGDLQAFFPAEQGQFLIGPMVKLAWGTPAILTASLAVIVEIPGNITFVGILRVALPTERPVLLLQVNFAGVLEPDQQRLYFSASLFQSRILHLTIDGDLGLLVAWGNDPNLVLTVGGFHPSYTPPPLPFPTPRRVSIDILHEPDARIRVSGYFAVTSNTVQFGANAELYFKFSAFTVEGHAGFDALFQLSPFAFAIQVSASVSFKAFGVGCFSIHLRFALEGPTPWRAHGRGGVSLFFFDISADFDITWGEHRDTTLPPIRVAPILLAELAEPANWQTRTPTTRPLVSLRRLPDTEDGLVLHPMGTLFVRQRAIPLGLKLDRIGGQRPSDTDRLTIEVTGGSLSKRADVTELFAPAQFQDMDDAAKLSRPAFQRQLAGLELAPDGQALASARAARRTARYEEIVIDTPRRRPARRVVAIPTSLFTHFLRGNSVSRSPLSQAQRSLRQPFADTIGIVGDAFAVAHTRDNTAAAPPFASAAAAQEYLARRLAEDPGLAGTLHVIPGAEVSG